MRRLFLSAALGGALLLGGVAACGFAGTGTNAVELAADSSPEAQALAGIGVNPADLAVAVSDPLPSASPSTGPGTGDQSGKVHRRRIRIELRKKLLHGEATIQTKNGPETVAGQRGTVTAVTATTVTVKSSDGFTQTWTFGNPIRVVQNKAVVQTSAVKTGSQVGVAGPETGGTFTARLIVLT
jgi:hypothetical protein